MVKKRVPNRYLITAFILIVLSLGFILVLPLPVHEGINAEHLLKNAISSERYISTDQVADKIIAKDPSFILIDVRDSEDHKAYALPGAINIPIATLLNEENETYLDQSQYDVIFYSNDNLYADQAWMLCNRLGYENLRVMEGGMNKWFTTVINPPVPDDKMAVEDFELYSTRKAASMYFGVMYPEQVVIEEPVVEKPVPKKIIPVKKKKKRPAEGGC